MGFILRTGQMHNVVVLGLFILIDKDKYRPDFSLHGYVNNRGLASPIAGNARQCFYAVAPYGWFSRISMSSVFMTMASLWVLSRFRLSIHCWNSSRLDMGFQSKWSKIVRFDGHPRAMFFMIVATMNCLGRKHCGFRF